MKKATKILALLLCAVLLVVASVGGTLAYLISKDNVSNTFTVGDVNIMLEENDYDKDGNFKQNDYTNVIPGVSYDKKPVVTVLRDSADCYVRAEVTVDFDETKWVNVSDDDFRSFARRFAAAFILNGDEAGFNANYWRLNDNEVHKIDTKEKTIVYYLYYTKANTNNVVKSSAANQPLPALFTKIGIPSGMDKETLPRLDGMKIDVEAHAIQSEGFEATVDENGVEQKTAEQNAWAAFDAQNNG